jgi:glycosyltransferase involved in cell wall biosynthesis
VATNVSDTPRVVVEGIGLIVPPHSPKSLARAINFFLEDSTRRQTFGSAARAFVAKNHNPDTWANKIISLYRSIQ